MTGGYHVHWLPLGFAALLALLSAWLNQVAERPLVQDNAGFSHDPDYIVERFRVQTYDLSGSPRHRLIAQLMIHYMDDDSSDLEQPQALLTSSGKAPITVTARRGVILGDRESVHFLGDAQATRAATPDQDAFSLAGEHLRVVPDAGILSSDVPVTFSQGKSVIHAGGLYVDEHNKRLELTGGVRGLYEKTR